MTRDASSFLSHFQASPATPARAMAITKQAPLAGTRRQAQVAMLGMQMHMAYSAAQREGRHLPQDERAQRIEALHEKYSAKVLDLATSLGGVYAKIAQAVAARCAFAARVHRSAPSLHSRTRSAPDSLAQWPRRADHLALSQPTGSVPKSARKSLRRSAAQNERGDPRDHPRGPRRARRGDLS